MTNAMTILVNLCWVALAVLHVMPSAVAFSPGLLARLYAVDPGGDVALLLRHRGAMFLGVVVASAWALLDAHSRRLAAAVVAMSMVSFLALYFGGGRRDGALESIARLDLIGLVPLLVVLYSAWRRES